MNNWTLQPFHKSGGCNVNPIIAHESRNEVVLSVQPTSDIRTNASARLGPQVLGENNVIEDQFQALKNELETSASVVCILSLLVAAMFFLYGGFDKSLKEALKILIEALVNIFPLTWLIFSDDIFNYAVRKVKNIFQVYLVI